MNTEALKIIGTAAAGAGIGWGVGMYIYGGQMEVYVAHEYPLDALVRRLYETLASAWDALGYSEEQRREFFTHGMPQRERTSLIEVLPPADAEWVRNA